MTAVDKKIEPSANVGKSVLRLENQALLRGRGRFMDDIAVPQGTLHAAVLRSPHAHAEIVSIDYTACLARPDVFAVVTGAEMMEYTDAMKTAVDTPMEYYGVATDRVRFVGEPVAVVCAVDRYAAEDALDDIKVRYKTLPAVIDPVKALDEGATIIHPQMTSNAYSTHHFKHGDPDRAFAEAEDIIEFTMEYPRNSIPPIECFACVAEYLPETGGYDVLSNFPGPFGMQPVMAWALRVKGNRLRMRTPTNAGGNFGTKLCMFPQIVVMCVASRLAGRPVKWLEDRLENLAAANSAQNRVMTLRAAHTAEGEVTAMACEHWDDNGAYLRAPMPGPIFRMHGTTSNGYKMKHLDVKMNIVATNKCPSGAVRGFGGPQLYFASERLMHKLARKLGKDPLEITRLNLIPSDSFPYLAPAGSLYDSGNFQRCIDEGVEQGNLAGLLKRREEVRARGGYYGIGYATAVEPSQSNMGYISILKPQQELKHSNPKDGAIANVTVAVDSSGAVNVVSESVPQGQGHATVLAQIVSDQLGLTPDEITVNLELDTEKDAWSIASGNYSSRFAPAIGSAAQEAAVRVRNKLATIASTRLNVPVDQIEFGGGLIYARDNADNSMKFHRTATQAHWSPGSLPEGMEPGVRERVAWSASELTPTNELGEVNSELAYGFAFDFCGVEIDPDSFDIRIDRYVSAHDCGTILNPAIVDGQVGGSFAAGLGAALYEEFVYDDDGAFYSGTFADYLVATAPEMPQLDIVHCTPTPSPYTALGAKGIGEGNTYSTPVCIANAIADALDLDDIVLPMSPSKVAELLMGDEPAPPEGAATQPAKRTGAGRALTGEGKTSVPASPQEVWDILLDPKALARVIPGCHELEEVGQNSYRADVDMGVGPVRGRFEANVTLSDLDEPKSATLTGDVAGPLGSGGGNGRVTLTPEEGGTLVTYAYEVTVSGKVASVGGRMLDGAARMVIGQFFNGLVRQTGGTVSEGLWTKVKRKLGLGQ
ncbi:xanthine dehydrogenase family protein molybdopterin-binding subunit [Roseovarius sp. Pro17]|uniref:xanthine dehydrogenase family protein molybdopterin-binding subunit n=1 Tax=Roseovarius sp. Pro17 TaxID=3108175 RepID=UPI002D782EF2|nr:molybdopterin cofactor-binding domain-containing protein [Roseovarius sp. Pro17]